MLVNASENDQNWNAAKLVCEQLNALTEELEKQRQRSAELEARTRTNENKSKQYLVLSVSEVAKDDELRARFRENQVAEEPCRGGFIAQEFYLDFVFAAREFITFKGKDGIVQQVADLGKLLTVDARKPHSLFSKGYLDEESPQSAVGSELFRLAIDLLQKEEGSEAEPSLRVTHQQHLVSNIAKTDRSLREFDIIRKKRKRESERPASGPCEDKKSSEFLDICAWFVHPNKDLGACVLAACEYKPSSMKYDVRKAQADMYGSNILLLHQKPCIVIDIAGANDLADWTVSAYGLVKAEFTSKPHSWEKSPLYVGKGAEAIVLVARGLLAARKKFPRMLRQYGCRLGLVVGVIDQFVYKVYDMARHRKPNIQVVQELLDSDAELLSSNDNILQIVKMKKMQNDWKEAVSSEVFHKIFEKLRSLHDKFGPHGDIRLANLLSCGSIIDFDFVGAEKYPSTYNSISQDGKRHPEVERMIQSIKEGNDELIKPEKIHDWYSLGHVMRLFEPTDSSNLTSWANFCCEVEIGSEDVSFVPFFPIKLKDGDMPLQGTGHTPIKSSLEP